MVIVLPMLQIIPGRFELALTDGFITEAQRLQQFQRVPQIPWRLPLFVVAVHRMLPRQLQRAAPIIKRTQPLLT